MKILSAGHRYELENFEHPEEPGQRIQFIEKQLLTHGGGELEAGALCTVNDGTTNEELLKVLIDRLTVLGTKFPCRENACAKTKVEEALMWLERRTADRQARGVEGKALA